MQSYLIEIYLPRHHARSVGAASRSVRTAVAELSDMGVLIHHVRTTYLPDDETCFHLVEAETPQAVDELCHRAGLGHARIVPALEA